MQITEQRPPSDAPSLPAAGQTLVSNSLQWKHVMKDTSITTDGSMFPIIIIIL